MNALLQFLRKLPAFFRRDRFSDDLAEEMAFHREQLENDLRAGGVSADEAHYAATRQFGNALSIKEHALDTVGIGLESAVQDCRYALRQLRQNPGFACTAILILALGIGATTAIFTAVHSILFRPLPYPHPERITSLWEMRGDGSPLATTFGTYHGMLERTRSFDALAVMKSWQPTMTGPSEPERFDGQRVSWAYFRVLGIAPVLGRDFQQADDQFKGPHVVVLSDKLWQRRFGRDPSIVGRQVTLDDTAYTVIGVMPPSFQNVPSPSAELWAPLQYDPSLPSDGREWGHHLVMIGRLHEGISRDQARAELNAILQNLGQIYARGYDSSGGVSKGVLVNSLQSDITRDVRPALLALFGAVLLLLLIACVNVTNLLLARASNRRAEFAMRVALGAQPSRLLRQTLTESLLLALLGAALGSLVSYAGLRALVAISPPELPRLAELRPDAQVFAFAVAITALVGVLLGLFPAHHASRNHPHGSLQQGARTSAGGHQFTRRVLVVAEVAVALVLLVGAGLVYRSMRRLFSTPPGFDSAHLLTMQVQESGRRFATNEARARFFEQALEAVRRVPGVDSAAFTSQLPLSGDFDSYGVQFEDYPNDNSEAGFRYAITPDYFRTMKIPLVRGRLLTENDRPGAPGAVVISESFARRKFPGMDPVGKHLRSGPQMLHPESPWDTIVGVVGDVKQASLAITAPDAFYVTTTQWAWVDNVQSLVVRTHGDPRSLISSIRQAIWSVDKDQPIVRIATMDRLLADSEAQRRFALLLFEAFALAALLLAATGIYAVVSGSVTERLREIGVRLAVGASRADILSLIVRQGMTLTCIGVVLGITAAALATYAVITLLFGVSRLDPATYLGVTALLVAVSAIACWIPASRASRVDPAITLRAE